MKLLAIDSATEMASVALLVDETLLERQRQDQKTHAAFILPMIDELMTEGECSLNQLDGILFGCGPGSFTGLRVTCSIAKGLAYAHDLPLFPVSSLATIAFSARELLRTKLPILALLDARMQEVYWGYFADHGYCIEEHLSAAHDLLLLEEKPIILAGVGCDLYWDNIPNSIKTQVQKRLTIYPTAKAMIDLALQTQITGVDPALAKPIYLRNQIVQGGARG